MSYLTKSKTWPVVRILIVAAIYVLLAKIGLMTIHDAAFASPVWPPSGFALAVLLLYGTSLWPGIFLGAFALSLSTGEPSFAGFAISAGNTLEAVVGAYLLNRVGFHKSLDRIADIISLVLLGALCSTLISPTIGITGLVLSGVKLPGGFSALWSSWWIGNILGDLIIAPLVLVWGAREIRKRTHWKSFEFVALLFTATAMSLWVYHWSNAANAFAPKSFVLTVFVIWACIRFGPLGSATSLFIISAVAVSGTLMGLGSFSGEPMREGLLLLDRFLGILSTTGLTLAASIADRKNAYEKLIQSQNDLAQSNFNLERVALERGEAQRDFKRLLDEIPGLVWGSPSNGIIDFFNKKWLEYTGVDITSFDTHDQQAWVNTIYPPDLKFVVLEWNNAVANQSPFQAEYRIRTKFGEYRWHLGRSIPMFDEGGKLKQWIGMAVDIHDQKLAKDGLKFLAQASEVLNSTLDYEETLKNLAHAAVPDFADWCSIYVSEEAGQPPKRIALAHVDPLKVIEMERVNNQYPLDWSESEGLAKIMRTGKSVLHADLGDSVLVRNAKNDDHLIQLRKMGLTSSIGAPLTVKGKALGVLLLMTAESKRRYTHRDLALAEELARKAALAIENALLYKQAQRAIESRDEFLSIASHELKTPITSLSLQIQMAKRNINPAQNLAPSPEKLARVFDISGKQVDRLTNLVEDLLNVSRIQTGKLSFAFEHVNLSEIVTDMLGRYLDQLAKVKCTLQTEIENNIFGQFDPARIEQIVDNLISNVIKYAPGGAVHISLSRHGGRVRFTVRDRGPGIPIEKQATIFERYERASTSNSVTGLGLGLFIVREVVKGHKGTVSLESHQGDGTTFTIELPLDAKNEETFNEA